MLKTQITGAKYLSPQTNQMTNLNIAVPADSKDTKFGTSDIMLAKDVVAHYYTKEETDNQIQIAKNSAINIHNEDNTKSIKLDINDIEAAEEYGDRVNVSLTDSNAGNTININTADGFRHSDGGVYHSNFYYGGLMIVSDHYINEVGPDYITMRNKLGRVVAIGDFDNDHYQISLGPHEKFKISCPIDNTKGATITGIKSIAAFSNPSATKVWATDGSTVDLSTKANASDILLKKSASGGYYIEGYINQLGLKAFAANSECTASGTYSFAEGSHIKASGDYSHAEGVSTEAIGTGSHAEGDGTKAQGNYAHAEGETTKALGNYSHAEGQSTMASGDFSHAEGSNTEAKNGSHAEGNYTHAVGTHTHAEGEYTSASGPYSHAEGFATRSNGDSSHSEGYNTNASGYCSHTEGKYTEATGFAQHAQGTYNVVNKNAIHSVGIGNNTTRKNAEYIYAKNDTNGYGLTDDPKNGYKYLIGVGGYDGVSTDNTTYKSVQEVIADLTSRIEQLETKVRALEAANTPA